MDQGKDQPGLQPTFRRRMSDLKQGLLYQLDPLGRASQAQLTVLKDSQRGKRCFILGNGPSLRQTDLSLLQGEFTFGLNRIYLLFPEMGFPTTYLVTINWLVLEQCAQEILGLPMTKFLPWSFHNRLDRERLSNVVFIQTNRARPGFTRDAREQLSTGATVTYVALQMAYHLGFQKVILIGVDHFFITQGKPHTAVVSSGDDPDHFSPAYFGQGFKWQLPDLDASERAYRMARHAFEADGREIVDATIGGKLTVFPKVEYSSLFR
jgi:hypothetical protein